MARVILPKGATVLVSGIPVTLQEPVKGTASYDNARRLERQAKGWHDESDDDGDETGAEVSKTMMAGPSGLQENLQRRREESQQADTDAQRLLRASIEDRELLATIQRSVSRGWF